MNSCPPPVSQWNPLPHKAKVIHFQESSDEACFNPGYGGGAEKTPSLSGGGGGGILLSRFLHETF